MLTYLLFPRPGPYFGAGKIAFFLLGSMMALTEGRSPHGIGAWLLVFVFYELVLSQGKYLLNDLAGRRVDGLFQRGTRNRFPAGGRTSTAVAAYAVARELGGLAGLLVAGGPFIAALGALTLGLQVSYELIKRTRVRGRGWGLFAVTAANYGVRALAGMAAIAPAAILSALGLLGFLWAAGVGALFLSIYWQCQGEYYLQGGRATSEILARYKPGVLAIYRPRAGQPRRRSPRLMEWLLRSLVAGSALFIFAGPQDAALSRAALLPVVLAMFATLTYFLLPSRVAALTRGARSPRYAA